MDQPIVILGAGLAGLAVADALLDHDHRRPVIIIDRRTAWERDRTWCTWDTGPPLRFAELAEPRWWAWRVSPVGGGAVVHRTSRHPYLHLDSRRLYDRVLSRLHADPRVTVRSGERVLGVETGPGRPEVVTARERLGAAWVVDALGPAGPVHGSVLAGAPVVQRFVGWEVETERPCFDPGVAGLMEFRAPPAGDPILTFRYVLPFTAHRALVEHTTIGGPGPGADARRAWLRAELTGPLDAGAYEILHEERGVIPMHPGPAAGSRPPGPTAARVFAVGAAGGAIRTSSGYAFTRTVRQAERLATALAADRPPSPPPAAQRARAARLAAYDRVFLSAMATRGDHGEGLFTRLARRVGADAFARFMTDVPTPGDEARILAALPPATMALAAARAAGGR